MRATGQAVWRALPGVFIRRVRPADHLTAAESGAALRTGANIVHIEPAAGGAVPAGAWCVARRQRGEPTSSV